MSWLVSTGQCICKEKIKMRNEKDWEKDVSRKSTLDC